MKRPLIAASLALLAVLAATALWLGPSALAWSARAALSPAGREAAWGHVPASAPGVAACRLQAMLGSPVALQLRPELDALAATQGADLAWFEARLEEVVVVHDGDATGYAVGRSVGLSPLLLSRLDGRWSELEGAGHAGASDGLLALFPLEPGLVLATESPAADAAHALASTGGASREPLSLEAPGLVLRALLEVTPALRQRMVEAAGARAAAYLARLERAELAASALDELELVVDLGFADETTASSVEALLRQVDSLARTSRSTAGFARALLGEAGALLADLPPLELSRRGAVVQVRALAGADEVRPWLKRALAALTPAARAQASDSPRSAAVNSAEKR